MSAAFLPKKLQAMSKMVNSNLQPGHAAELEAAFAHGSNGLKKSKPF